jgi:hypothetical protein
MKKFSRSITIAKLVILLTTTSCGYLENEATGNEVAITGNILLQKQEGSADTLFLMNSRYSILISLNTSLFQVIQPKTNDK